MLPLAVEFGCQPKSVCLNILLTFTHAIGSDMSLGYQLMSLI